MGGMKSVKSLLGQSTGDLKPGFPPWECQAESLGRCRAPQGTLMRWVGDVWNHSWGEVCRALP